MVKKKRRSVCSPIEDQDHCGQLVRPWQDTKSPLPRQSERYTLLRVTGNIGI